MSRAEWFLWTLQHHPAAPDLPPQNNNVAGYTSSSSTAQPSTLIWYMLRAVVLIISIRPEFIGRFKPNRNQSRLLLLLLLNNQKRRRANWREWQLIDDIETPADVNLWQRANWLPLSRPFYTHAGPSRQQQQQPIMVEHLQLCVHSEEEERVQRDSSSSIGW